MAESTGGKKVEAGLDAAIAILTKTNALTLIASVVITGIFDLWRKKGIEVPVFTPAELNAAMHDAAEAVILNADDKIAKIRAEFNLPPA